MGLLDKIKSWFTHGTAVRVEEEAKETSGVEQRESVVPASQESPAGGKESVAPTRETTPKHRTSDKPTGKSQQKAKPSRRKSKKQKRK
jgi:hypothetical protein